MTKKTFNLNDAINKLEPIEQEDTPLDAEDKENIDAIEKEMESKPQNLRSKEELIDEIVALTQLVNDSEDKMKRALAELENVRRRRDIDVQNAHKYGVEKFVKELLSVVDSFEIALTTITDDTTLEGIKLTHKMFIDALKKSNVEQLDPIHQPFNPDYHQAISQLENKNHKPNTVIKVMQKGYTLSGRIIRPALVIVSK